MGFYGNITNVNKSTFQFDKIYPNRAAMDYFCASDGVFIGRYVLVDYDTNNFINGEYLENLSDLNKYEMYVEALKNSTMSLKNKHIIIGYQLFIKYPVEGTDEKAIVPAYGKEDDSSTMIFLTGGVNEDGEVLAPAIKYGEIVGGDTITKDTYVLCVGKVIQEISVEQEETEWYLVNFPPVIDKNAKMETTAPKLYVCTGGEDEIPNYSDEESQKFIENVYGLNHQIDADVYGGLIGRGWDSTVWEKVYKDGKVSYIMIAELNSVVPTFDISVDAPTASPLMPHWDTDTSNIYYKLHVQPQWGIRIKGSDNDEYTEDEKIYPSDIAGSFPRYSRLEYNAELKDYVLDEDIRNDKPLAIYYNQKGFNPNRSLPLNDDFILQSIPDAKNTEKEYKIEEGIQLRPTGLSDYRLYNYHDGSGYHKAGKKPDTYELSIMLPSIGQAISSVWDIVYGQGRAKDIKNRFLWSKDDGLFATDTVVYEDSGNTKIKTPATSLRNRNIEWNSINGLRLIQSQPNDSFVYDPSAMGTVAGAINSMQDLMGMIVVQDEGIDDETVAEWDPTKIYFVNGKFYRKKKDYVYTENTNQYIQVNNLITDFTNYWRQTDLDFPRFDDEKIMTETERALALTRYHNYKKVNSAADVIEGAVYGTISSGDPVALITEQIPEETKVFKKVSTIPLQYKEDNTTQQAARVGEYVTIEATQCQGFEFYTPKKYFLGIKNNPSPEWEEKESYEVKDFDSFIRCEQDSYSSILSTYNGKGLVFFKNVELDENDSGTTMVEDLNNPMISSEIPFPEDENRYSYNNSDKVLILYSQLDEEGNKTELIRIKNGVNNETIIFNQNKKVYKSRLYKVANGSGQYTVWDAYEEGIELRRDANNNLVPAYNYKIIPGVPQYNLRNAQIINLQDFNVGGPYFYQNNATPLIYTQENWENLKWNNRPEGAYGRNQMDGNGLIGYYTLSVRSYGAYYSLADNLYYKEPDNDWMRETAIRISTEDEGAQGRYYKITFNKVDNPLFRENYYYTDATGSEFATVNSSTFYEKVGRYVISDSEGIYAQGAEWNEEIVPVPTGVVLGTRQVKWVADEIPELSKELNTAHGLILKINNKLLDEDTKTRDLNTVQGCINKINDILDKFHQLVPAEIAMVDAYGRVHSGDWDSKQKSGYSNIGKPSADVAVPAGDPVAADNERWLKLTTTSGTSSNDYKPHIKLEHTFKSADDTNTTADKNVANSGDGLNKGNGDTLKLYTPIVDNMGHVVGKNTETVTLPYGFKTVSIGAESNAVANLAHAAADLVAENTQDTLAINPGNKWMKLAGTANNDSFSIGHLVQTIDTTRAADSDINDNGDTITIQDISNDEAGHITANKLHTYTLPYGFKTITGNNGSLVADNTQDTAAFSGDTWIQATAINDGSSRGIAFTHIGPDANITHTAISDVSPKFGKSFMINDWTFDNKGHKSDGGTHEVTIPAPSITGSGNVVNGATLSSDGDFTLTKVNVGTLALTGYNEAESNPLIAASDTINGAIKKLENILDNSSTSVNTRISNEITTFKGLINDAESAGTVYGIVNKAKLDLTDYINAQISELTAPANPWGAQLNIGADVGTGVINTSDSITAGTKINLTSTDAVEYGSSYYDIVDGGIKIKTAGLYKIQGSAVFYLKPNTLGKVWIGKDPAGGGSMAAVSGAVESTGSAAASNLIISLADTLVNLDVDDMIYLYAGATSTECSIKKNSLTYILLELLSSASQQNNNGGGE